MTLVLFELTVEYLTLLISELPFQRKITHIASVFEGKNMNKVLLCNQEHLIHIDEAVLTDLTLPQVNSHSPQVNSKAVGKCYLCAYNSGYQQGSLLQKFISLDIDSLGESGVSRDGTYKSVHQAFALGYSDGVNFIINN